MNYVHVKLCKSIFRFYGINLILFLNFKSGLGKNSIETVYALKEYFVKNESYLGRQRLQKLSKIP